MRHLKKFEHSHFKLKNGVYSHYNRYEIVFGYYDNITFPILTITYFEKGDTKGIENSNSFFNSYHDGAIDKNDYICSIEEFILEKPERLKYILEPYDDGNNEHMVGFYVEMIEELKKNEDISIFIDSDEIGLL